MLNRLKRAWSLPKKNPLILEELMEQKDIPDIGEGAVFLGEGTHEEFIEQQREDEGTKHWYDFLKP